MMTAFRVSEAPSAADWERLADRYPENPFCTAPFIETHRQQGSQPWLLELEGGGGSAVACAAFLKTGSLTRQLVVHSAPEVPQETVGFWPSVAEFCRRRQVSEIEVNSYGSPPSALPDLGHVLWRRARVEFVLDLDRRVTLATNHRRNVSKAERAGVEVRTTGTEEASGVHAQLMSTSLARREASGQQVSMDGGESARTWQLVKAGAGTLFQAVLGPEPEVLSSMLVLKARRGAYYHSAGSSTKGMELGASHLLVRTIADTLGNEGLRRFNLGGANSEGLSRFKAGFGARRVDLESAAFFLAGRARRQFVYVLRAAREHLKEMSRSRPSRV